MVLGAIITGRPLSNSTACSASEDDRSSPASGCGTTVRSASRASCATRSSSRPLTTAKLADAASPCTGRAVTGTPCDAAKRSNRAWIASARRAASLSVAAIMSSIIAPDSPSPASGATSRLSTRTCSAARWPPKISATIQAVASAASPAWVPVSGTSSLRMGMEPPASG